MAERTLPRLPVCTRSSVLSLTTASPWAVTPPLQRALAQESPKAGLLAFETRPEWLLQVLRLGAEMASGHAVPSGRSVALAPGPTCSSGLSLESRLRATSHDTG